MSTELACLSQLPHHVQLSQETTEAGRKLAEAQRPEAPKQDTSSKFELSFYGDKS